MAAALQHSWVSSSSLKVKTTRLFSSSSNHHNINNSPFKLGFSQSLKVKTTRLFSSSSNHHNINNSPFKLGFSQSRNQSNDEIETPHSQAQLISQETAPVVDPVKLAFQKAKAYKNTQVNPDSEIVPGTDEIASGKTDESGVTGSQQKQSKSVEKKEKLTISSIDFLGLGFADKKTSRGLPPGLIPVPDPFPEGDLPEVEIIVGDTTKFGDGEATSTTLDLDLEAKPSESEEKDSDFYNPKVSTWGVFPRPGNISKTFGGGRTIRPGQVLETPEDRAAKDKRTRELLSAYKKQVGLNVDPNLRSECDKAMKDGDSLMDSGKLKDALSYYEKVMEKLPYKSELHGLAALQWSICQDSLSRPNEARIMYEKLQSHPNAEVSKKARQLMFSFKAMEMMKVKGSNLSLKNTGYQNYFEAFIEDKANYTLEGAEIPEFGALNQALPYMIFLLSPIVAVLFIAIQKGYAH
ncbi:hypothetical protein CCACVL1_05427 [Corchorus capsularis]|uniref:Tetratricopeptide-like helical n=1 Tax=Corchorus capsularis TaxID=210143 RepID=A0A1R3JKM1_COCAP|nr:hypothetical protein CCACVL1_05427 [Corchorus capsularis]